MKNVIGILNFHSSPSIPPITDSRPLGSTSFLGRYACCDFPLSCFTNSGIQTVGLLVKDHQRSILKHLGSMDAWQSNTKISKTVVMFNESAQLRPSYNTDIANIRENDWVIYDSNATHIVILPAHILATFDLDAMVEEHIKRGEYITVIATPVAHVESTYLNQPVLQLDNEGYVLSSKLNKGKEKGKAICSMSAFIINRTTLADLCTVEAELEPRKNIRELVLAYAKRRGSRVHAQIYSGASICMDSFAHYVESSFKMLDPSFSSEFFSPSFPIYTLTHDTPPTIYGRSAKVSESYIANGGDIHGTVTHSILARDVKVGKGAIVKNSIIFSSVKIDDGAVVENAVIDKFSIVTKNHSVKGTQKNFLYIHQGAIL